MPFPAGIDPEEIMGRYRAVVSELAKGNRDLLESGQRSDFTVTCQNRVWKVHQAIVCTRSLFFTRALESGFKESETRNVTIDYDEPALICRMLKYLYVFDYCDTIKDVIPGVAPLSWPWIQDLSVSDSHDAPHKLEVNARMYILADMYGIDSLKEVALTKFSIAAYTKHSRRGMCNAEIYSVAFEMSALSPSQLVDTLVLIWKNTCDSHDALRNRVLTLIYDIRETIDWNGELERLATLSPDCAGAIMASLMTELIMFREMEDLK